MNWFTKQNCTHRHRKPTYGYQRGKVARDKLGVCDEQIHNIIYKIEKQQGLPYSRENYIQYIVITYNGKESKKECVYIYITESLCCTPETNTTL